MSVILGKRADQPAVFGLLVLPAKKVGNRPDKGGQGLVVHVQLGKCCLLKTNIVPPLGSASVGPMWALQQKEQSDVKYAAGRHQFSLASLEVRAHNICFRPSLPESALSDSDPAMAQAYL